MTNSTSIDVIFTAAWGDRMVAKHYGCHSTAPADKQINVALNLLPANRKTPDISYLTGKDMI